MLRWRTCAAAPSAFAAAALPPCAYAAAAALRKVATRAWSPSPSPAAAAAVSNSSSTVDFRLLYDALRLSLYFSHSSTYESILTSPINLLLEQASRTEGPLSLSLTYDWAIIRFKKYPGVGFGILGDIVKRGCLCPGTRVQNLIVHLRSTTWAALDLLRGMASLGSPWKPADTLTYEGVILSLCKYEGNVDVARELLREMVASSVCPSADTFYHVIFGYSVLGRWEDAVDVLGEMFDHGISMTYYDFGSMIGDLCFRGRTLEAHRLFDFMADRAGTAISRDPTPSMQVYGLADHMSNGAAKHLFDKAVSVAGHRPTVHSYNILIDSYCKNGQSDVAMRLFEEMQDRGLKPNAKTCKLLLRGLCKSQRLEDTESVLLVAHKHERRLGAVTYDSLITLFCNSGRLARAAQLLMEMMDQRIRPRVATFVTLMDALCEAGEGEQAHRLFQVMIQTSRNPTLISNDLLSFLCRSLFCTREARLLLPDRLASDGYIPSDHTYSMLIEMHCMSFDVDEAMEVYREMIRKGTKPNAVTYSLLLEQLFSKGNVAAAQALYNEMLIHGVAPDLLTYRSMIRGLCECASLDEALALFDTVDANVLKEGVAIHTTLLEGLYRAGRFTDARKLLSLVSTGGADTPDCYYSLVRKLLVDGFFDEAADVVSCMEENGFVPTSKTYNAILSAFLRKGRICEAMEYIGKIKSRELSLDREPAHFLSTALHNERRFQSYIGSLASLSPDVELNSSANFETLWMAWRNRASPVEG